MTNMTSYGSLNGHKHDQTHWKKMLHVQSGTIKQIGKKNKLYIKATHSSRKMLLLGGEWLNPVLCQIGSSRHLLRGLFRTAGSININGIRFLFLASFLTHHQDGHQVVVGELPGTCLQTFLATLSVLQVLGHLLLLVLDLFLLRFQGLDLTEELRLLEHWHSY